MGEMKDGYTESQYGAMLNAPKASAHNSSLTIGQDMKIMPPMTRKDFSPSSNERTVDTSNK